MNLITVNKLSQGGGSGKVIKSGESLIVTKGSEPVALYRPYREDDEGAEIAADPFYHSVRKHVGNVASGNSVIVTKWGVPFATLCKLEEPAQEPPISSVAELEEAIPILRVTTKVPREDAIELLELGARLAKKGRLEWALRMLRSTGLN